MRTSPSTRPTSTPANGRYRSATRSTRPPCPCARYMTRGTSASKCRPATRRRSLARRATGQRNSALPRISGLARGPLPRRPTPGPSRREQVLTAHPYADASISIRDQQCSEGHVLSTGIHPLGGPDRCSARLSAYVRQRHVGHRSAGSAWICIRRCWFVVYLGEPAHRRHEALWLVAGCPAGRQVVSWPAVARRASPGPVSVLGGPGIFPYSRLSRALAAMCQVRQSLARGPEPEAASG